MSDSPRPTLCLRGDWWHLAGPRASVRLLPGVFLLLLQTPRLPVAIGRAVILLVVAGTPLGLFLMVRRSELVVSDEGVTDRRLWTTRHWSWDEAVVLAPGPVYGSRYSSASGSRYLMVCVGDDPYAHTLKGIGFGANLDAMWCLDRIARTGYPVDTRTDASPEEWWVDDPRRRAPKP